MSETEIGSAVASELTATVTLFSVDPRSLEGPTDLKDNTWINDKWEDQLGFYDSIPELRAVIDAVATWTVGKGFTADEQTTMLLNTIRGHGKDTLNIVLENMIRVMMIGGDSYALQTRDKEDNLLNIRPLDPGSMRIHMNEKGMLTHYTQVSKISKGEQKYELEEIFHLSRNRIGDEMHGISLITALETIIKMRNESMQDQQLLMHRNVKPITIFSLDFDNPAKVAAFKAIADNVVDAGENMYIPKGNVEVERVSVPQFSTLNPLPWIQALNSYFYQATGGTDIVIGGSGELTDANAKIKYLAYEQNIRENQMQITEQFLAQINLEIDLEFPASLENDLLSGKDKAGSMTAAKPNDVVSELEGPK